MLCEVSAPPRPKSLPGTALLLTGSGSAVGGLRHILICFSLSPCNGEASFSPTLQMGLSNWATVTQPGTEDLASHSSRPLADLLYPGACHTRGPCRLY